MIAHDVRSFHPGQVPLIAAKYNLLFADVYRHFGAQPPQAVAETRTLTLALALGLALTLNPNPNPDPNQVLCHPPVVRLLSELLAPGYRLDHSPLMIAMDKVMLTLT